MRRKLFTFSFQHAFNWPIRFLDGRSSSLLFVSVILLTIFPKGMTVFKKKFSSSFNSACKSSSKLCALVPREAIVCYIFQASVTSSILFVILFSTYPLQDASRVEGAFTLGARHGYCQRIDKQWHRKERIFQFLDSVLQSGIVGLHAFNGVMKFFSGRGVKLTDLGRLHVGNVNL
jgi:hypothetical protein